MRLRVLCSARGAAADTAWYLSYVQDTGMHHDNAVPAAHLTTAGSAAPRIDPDRSRSPNREGPTISRTKVGQYDLWYQSMGWQQIFPADDVDVTAVGCEPRYCRTQIWNSYSFAPKVHIIVFSFDGNGRSANAAFALAYLRAP